MINLQILISFNKLNILKNREPLFNFNHTFSINDFINTNFHMKKDHKNNSNKFRWIFLGLILALLVGRNNGFAQELASPPQDKGLPYTRTAHASAMKALKGTIAIYVGSRYAYVHGDKVRIDNKNLLRGEAILKNGKIYIPESFAGVLTVKKTDLKPIPKGLEILSNRWVYDITLPKTKIPTTLSKIQVNGNTFIDIAVFAKSLGKQVLQTKSGLLLISDKTIQYKESDPIISDCVISAFDTPEKLMDPDIATRNIPLLKQQGKWTEHARVSPENLKDLEEGPETIWPETARSLYNFTGFNKALLGSKVPAPGIYPRLLFSPQDIPMLQQHIKNNKSATKSLIEIEVLFKKSWWDPTTSDGKIFDLLASGKMPTDAAANTEKGVYAISSLTKDHIPGIYTSHINYVTNCLTTMALYCLITDNDKLGKKVANAISTYYKMIDAAVDQHVLTSDSEFGVSPDKANSAETQWRGMHGTVPHMDLAFSLDFAGKYMTPEQRKNMQNLIAKATYGRRTGGGDGPRRAWRDINHVTWHLTHHIAIASIEGLDGFDPEAWASGCELTRDFLELGIDKNGQMFESNGKSGGGIQFEFLAMIIQARRGDNLFGHPHLRKMLTAQVYTTSPNRKETVSSGTWGGSPFVLQTLTELKAFFPDDRAADYLIQAQLPDLDLASFNAEEYRAKITKNSSQLRLPGPTYPGFGIGFPYIADWKPTTREDLKLPLNWNTEVHGVLSTSSDRTPDATWLCLNVRANHYIGSGHHHADIGMFYFSGLGVNWFTEMTPKTYTGKYHNEVIIDGKAEADGPPAKGKYIGASMNDNGAFGTVDQTYCYTWQWCTQVQNWGTGFAKIDSTVAKNGWELETDPEIMDIFRGTTNYKMRPWWPTYDFSNFIPTLRALWNPVEYVYRTTGLVRGKHAYGVITDDLKKDNSQHTYQWTAMLGKGVYKANYTNIPEGCSVLAFDQARINAKPDLAVIAIDLKQGDPLLLVVSLDPVKGEPVKVEVATDGPDEGKGPTLYNRINIEKKVKQVNYKVLLIPFKNGDKLPEITYKVGKATVKWADQTDVLTFTVNANRTSTEVARNGETILKSK